MPAPVVPPPPVLAADPAAQGGSAAAGRVDGPMDTDLAHVTWSIWEDQHEHHPLELNAGPIFWRKRGDRATSLTQGFEGSVGTSTLVRVRPFVMFATTELTLRALDSSSYALSYMQSLSAGLVLGPVEPDLRASLSMVTVDVLRGNWSAELLSPRVAAGVWLHIGRLGLGAHAFGEYLWRWLGNGDVIDRGFVFELSFER
jgi:hypothetical protein